MVLFLSSLGKMYILFFQNKELQNNNSDTSFFAHKIKTNYLMTKQVVWTFRTFFCLQFDTKFASKQQRLAKVDTILWLLLSTQISQVWLATGKIRRRKGQYYQSHMPRSWPLSTTARFATKGGLIQIQTGMHWWKNEWNIISSKAGAGYFGHNELN